MGVEPLEASGLGESGLRQSALSSGAKSGAVAAETAELTVDALATALLGLSTEDRARLAALLLGQQADGAKANPPTPDAPAGR